MNEVREMKFWGGMRMVVIAQEVKEMKKITRGSISRCYVK